MWHVYILQCRDGSLYTGATTDIDRRLRRHNSGKASKYTRTRRPVDLLYIEHFRERQDALRREREIKDFSLENKKRLIKFSTGRRFPSSLKVELQRLGTSSLGTEKSV